MNTMFATLEPLNSIGEIMSSDFQISTREDRGTTWIKVSYCKGQTIQNSPWSVAVYNLYATLMPLERFALGPPTHNPKHTQTHMHHTHCLHIL